MLDLDDNRIGFRHEVLFTIHESVFHIKQFDIPGPKTGELFINLSIEYPRRRLPNTYLIPVGVLPINVYALLHIARVGLENERNVGLVALHIGDGATEEV